MSIWCRAYTRFWPRLGWFSRWLLCLIAFLVGCTQAPGPKTAVFLARPGQLIALDSRDGREQWEGDLPPDPVCDVAPSPDGRWVAVLQRGLVILSIESPFERIIADSPPGWFFPSCIRPYGRVDSPGALLSWADTHEILVMVRKSFGGQELRGITAFDLKSRAWRPWVQQLVPGCWLLAQPSREVQLSCERLRFGRWPLAFSGLLGIDPTNGVIRRWVTLSPPQRLIALGVPEVSPVVGVAQSGEYQYVLTESGVLYILDRSGYVLESLLVWHEAGLVSRASGKALRVDRSGTVAWVVLWRADAPSVLALVELRSRAVPRTLVLDERLVDLDFLDDGVVVLLLDEGAGFRVVRRELRPVADRELGMLSRETTCCWVGPLAPGD